MSDSEIEAIRERVAKAKGSYAGWVSVADAEALLAQIEDQKRRIAELTAEVAAYKRNMFQLLEWTKESMERHDHAHGPIYEAICKEIASQRVGL